MNKKTKFCLFFLFPFLIFLCANFLSTNFELFELIEAPNSSGALCIDGSKYQFYLKRSPSSKKFILFFDGGGWCSNKVYANSLESCVKRTGYYLGSSDYILNHIFSFFGYYPNYKPWMYFLSNDEANNPDFHDYNKVILKYCDGRSFVGFNDDPIDFDGKSLYFRGFNNTKAVLKYLEANLTLNDAETVIVSGMSAGGLAALIYSNYIREVLPKSCKVKTISDSGVFLDFQNIDNIKNYTFSSVWKNLIVETKPTFPEGFLESYCRYNGSELYKCFLPEFFAQEIKIPVFAIMSLYDAYSVYTFVGDHCPILNNGDFCYRKEVEEHRQKITDFFLNVVGGKKDWGGFFPACFLHDYLQFSFDWDNEKVRVAGLSLKEAVGKWMRGEEVRIMHEGEGIDGKCKGHLGLFYYMAYSGILMDIF